jgi:oligoribonuclease NrnB/cAMP/cGMP phosphodiesterase (DHH superfamily)
MNYTDVITAFFLRARLALVILQWRLQNTVATLFASIGDYMPIVFQPYFTILGVEKRMFLLFHHKECLDGITSTLLYKKYIVGRDYSFVIGCHPTDVLTKEFPILSSMIRDVPFDVVFLDCVARDIETLVPNSVSNFHIVDHHISNEVLIENIKNNTNLQTLVYQPREKWGASKLVLDMCENKVSKDETEFATYVGASDMWNVEVVPDCLEFKWGMQVDLEGKIATFQDVEAYLQNGLHHVDRLLTLGEIYYYDWIEKYGNFLDGEVVEHMDYKILFVKLREENGNDMTEDINIMTKFFRENREEDVVCYYGKKNAGYRKFVSLRALGEKSVLPLAQRFDGGGHEKASGCRASILRLMDRAIGA